MLGCNTGLRVPKAPTLEFADADWDRRALRVRDKPHLNFHVKNYQERHIRLNSQGSTALQSVLVKRHFSGERLSSAVQKLETPLPNSLPRNGNPGGVDASPLPLTLTKNWCGGPESNRHIPYGTRDFKSLKSTSAL